MAKNNNLQETVGRRKTAIARVFLRKGSGKITVNNKDLTEYFIQDKSIITVKEPLILLRMEKDYDILVTVQGGGITAQAEAIRLGISRALNDEKPVTRATLKEVGFLTRDPREVERKKYGQKGARRRFQFSKR